MAAAARLFVRRTGGPTGPLRVVFPFGGAEHEVHSLCCIEQAEVVLACLQHAAAEAADAPAAASGGGFGQLVRELQECVQRSNSEQWNQTLSELFQWGHVHELLSAAAKVGHASAARQLLLCDPQAVVQGESTDRIPIHTAALRGHAALVQLLLAAVPAAATTTCLHINENGDEVEGWSLLHSAVCGRSVEAMEALLALAPQMASSANSSEVVPLHISCNQGHAGAARCLLAASPATAAAQDSNGYLPVHWAAMQSAEVVQLLLDAAGPSQLFMATKFGYLPLHLAAAAGNVKAVRLLLAVAPQAAAVENASGRRPLHEAIFGRRSLEAARALLPVSGLGPDQVLKALSTAGPAAQPLYADLAALMSLSDAQWQQVPAPCPGLGRALPAVLARSEAEARQLVRRLPAAAVERLRTAVLCLARAQRGPHGVPLPEPLVCRILALSVDA